MSVQTPLRDKPRPPVTEPGWGVRVAHLLVSLVGWALFGLFWFEVFVRTPPEEGVRGIVAVGVLLVASIGFTVLWIRHNLLLSRRFENRRRLVRDVQPRWTHDVVGRPLDGPGWEVVQGSADVEIAVDPANGHKRYRVS